MPQHQILHPYRTLKSLRIVRAQFFSRIRVPCRLVGALSLVPVTAVAADAGEAVGPWAVLGGLAVLLVLGLYVQSTRR